MVGLLTEGAPSRPASRGADGDRSRGPDVPTRAPDHGRPRRRRAGRPGRRRQPKDALRATLGLTEDLGLVLLETDDAAFTEVARGLRDAIDRGDAVTKVLASEFVLAAARLRMATLAEAKGAERDAEWYRLRSTAERQFYRSLSSSNRLDRHAAQKAKDAPPKPKLPQYAPLPPVTPEEFAKAKKNWRERIAMVKSVHRSFPILLKFRVPVDTIIGERGIYMSDGRLAVTWPGITMLDLAACLGCQDDGLMGPFSDWEPLPEGLPVLDEIPDDEGVP